MSTVSGKRTRRMPRRRAKIPRFGAVAWQGNYFDTLNVDLTAKIASFVVQDGSDDEVDTHSSNAIRALEVGGVLAEGAAVAFGSWEEFRQTPHTNVEKGVLSLATVGEGYKKTRRLGALMGARLHTVAMLGGMTKTYADILRVHAKGLRKLHVSGVCIDSSWIRRVLSGIGNLDRLSIQLMSCQRRPGAALIEGIPRIKEVHIQFKICCSLLFDFRRILRAATAPGSITRLITIDAVTRNSQHFQIYCDVLRAHLSYAQTIYENVHVHLVVDGQDVPLHSLN